MAEPSLSSRLPQEPPAPVHKVRRQSRLRRSVRVILRRRGISLRRRRQREKLSIPVTAVAVLSIVGTVATWGWFQNANLPWLDRGPCRLAFVLALALALLSGTLFVVNVHDVLSAKQREAEREAARRVDEEGRGR